MDSLPNGAGEGVKAGVKQEAVPNFELAEVKTEPDQGSDDGRSKRKRNLQSLAEDSDGSDEEALNNSKISKRGRGGARGRGSLKNITGGEGEDTPDVKPDVDSPATRGGGRGGRLPKPRSTPKAEPKIEPEEVMDNPPSSPRIVFHLNENVNNNCEESDDDNSDDEIDKNVKGDKDRQETGTNQITLSTDSSKKVENMPGGSQEENPEVFLNAGVIEVCCEEGAADANQNKESASFERVFQKRFLDLIKIQIEGVGTNQMVIGELKKSIEEKKKEADVTLGYLEKVNECETRHAKALKDLLEAFQDYIKN